jgi:hypothetical protein
MGHVRNTCKGEEEFRSAWRRWERSVEIVLMRYKDMNWIHLTLDTVHWQVFVNI